MIGLKTFIFAPETFNLAETTRMIEVAKEFDQEANCLFIGYSTEFSSIIEDEGFPFTLLTPTLTKKQISHIMKFDQGKSLKNPFDYNLLKERIESELIFIEKTKPNAIIIGTTISLLISARVKEIPLIYAKPFALSRGHLESNSFLNGIPGRKLISQLALKLKWLPKDMKKIIKEYHVEKINKLIKTTDKPIIFCSLGSSANSKLVFQVLQNFEGLDVEVISPMKYFLNEEQIEKLPQNIHLFDWLPALNVQLLVDASVLHGGEGTVQTACFSGKPFIGIGIQAEQTYNIKSCVTYGNAINFKLKKVKQKNLFQSEVMELLTNQNLINKANELKIYFDKEETGAKKTYHLINNYLTKQKEI